MILEVVVIAQVTWRQRLTGSKVSTPKFLAMERNNHSLSMLLLFTTIMMVIMLLLHSVFLIQMLSLLMDRHLN